MTELWMLLHDTTYFPPVATRHHHVEQHNRRLHGLEESQCLLSACRHRDRVATNLKVFANDVGVVAIIVDHEDGWQLLGSHCSAPPRHEGDGRTHGGGARTSVVLTELRPERGAERLREREVESERHSHPVLRDDRPAVRAEPAIERSH